MLSTTSLAVILLLLILSSGFFSAAETALISINRYRLRHLVKSKNRTAVLISRLLARLDKLLSVVLIGNTFANIMAAAVTTIIANSLYGEAGVLTCTVLLTLVT